MQGLFHHAKQAAAVASFVRAAQPIHQRRISSSLASPPLPELRPKSRLEYINELHKAYGVPDPPFSINTRQEKWDIFERWVLCHNKVYDTEEEKMRIFEVFSRTLEITNAHYADYFEDFGNGGGIGLSFFSDVETMGGRLKVPDDVNEIMLEAFKFLNDRYPEKI